MSNELVETLTGDLVPTNVVSIQDTSDRTMDRILVVFSNGLEVGVIRGSGSYGGQSDLFEVAIYLEDNMSRVLFTNDIDNDVRGWLSVSDVNGILQKAAAWGAK